MCLLAYLSIPVTSRETFNISYVQPIEIVHNHLPGRPRKRPNPTLLQAAMAPGRHISVTKLARLLGIHRHTLCSYLQEYKIDYGHTLISDSDLDQLIKHFRALKPQSGIRYLLGSLRRHGLRIQHNRIAASLHRVDPLGHVLRRHTTIRRRQYHVPRPNAMWHIDGHHKLIHWGIVIHGIVDGYCRTVSLVRLLVSLSEHLY